MIDGNIDVVSLTGDITDSVSLEGELLPIGPKGDKGDPGFSPVVTTSKSGKTTTVKFETATGNVYAYIQDGEDGQGSGDMMTDVYDQNKNGIVDNAEKVNNHTVLTDVPANAVFTDVNAVWGNITGTLTNQTDLNTALGNKANTSDLSAVATSGSYNDLSNKPTNVSTFTNDANYVTSNGNAESTQTNVSSATFTNTLEAPMEIDLKGNTLQNGTPTPSSPIPINNVSGDNDIVVCGKNLIDLTSTTNVGNNATIISTDKNEITITATATTYSRVGITKYLSAGTYTISNLYERLSGSDTNLKSNIIQIFKGGSVISQDSNTGTTFTLSENSDVEIRFLLFTNSAGTNGTQVRFYNVMLEQGNQATTYEAYNGTTYNIDLPVENLFDKDNANVISAYINGSGKIVSDVFPSTIYIACKPNTNYAIQKALQPTTASNRFKVGCCASTPSVDTQLSKYNNLPNGTTDTTMIFETDSTANYLVFNFAGGAQSEVLNELNTIQIEEGSKVNSFTPYGTTPIELNKIGTYQDYIYKENDKWYLHKEINKIAIVSGGYLSSGSNENFAQFNMNISSFGIGVNNQDNGLCNYFKYYSGVFANRKSDSGFGLFGGGTLALSVPRSIAPSGSENTSFATWLENHQTYYWYKLATPTNIEITYTPLINQLDNIKNAMSKEGTTNVNQVNNDAPFMLDLSVFNDTYNGRYEGLKEQIPSKDNLVNVGTYVNDNYKVNMLYSHNLFDKNNVNVLNAYIGTANGTIAVLNNGRTIWIPIKANTTYTISKLKSARFVIATYTKQPALNVSGTNVAYDNDATSLTITSGASDKYLAVWLYNSDVDTLTYQQIIDSLMINEGSEALPYEPHLTPSINVNGEEIYKYNQMRTIWAGAKHTYNDVLNLTEQLEIGALYLVEMMAFSSSYRYCQEFIYLGYADILQINYSSFPDDLYVRYRIEATNSSQLRIKDVQGTAGTNTDITHIYRIK